MTPERIIRATAAVYGIDASQVSGLSTDGLYTRARLVAMALCKSVGSATYTDMSRAFNRKPKRIQACLKTARHALMEGHYGWVLTKEDHDRYNRLLDSLLLEMKAGQMRQAA